MSGTQSALLGVQSAGIKPNGLLNGSSVLSYTNLGAETAALSGAGGHIKAPLTGAQTANVLATVLSMSGKGCISFLALHGIDATSRTHRVKVTLDGVVVFDATSAAATGDYLFFSVIGAVTKSSAYLTYEPLIFDTSLLIEYASSLTETAKTRFGYRYTPRA